MSVGLAFTMRFHGVPIVISETAPLRKTRSLDAPDYEHAEVESDALCLVMDGVIYVHPERYPLFESLEGRLP